jgi:NADH dehydrogenase FAD-containing subunit
MSEGEDFESRAQQVLQCVENEGTYHTHTNNKDYEALCSALSEVRDDTEIVHTTEYATFLKAMHGALVIVLEKIKPQFEHYEDAQDKHKARNTCLEILQRLPCNEVRSFTLYSYLIRF